LEISSEGLNSIAARRAGLSRRVAPTTNEAMRASSRAASVFCSGEPARVSKKLDRDLTAPVAASAATLSLVVPQQIRAAAATHSRIS